MEISCVLAVEIVGCFFSYYGQLKNISYDNWVQIFIPKFEYSNFYVFEI